MNLYVSNIESASTEVVYTYFDSEHVWGINLAATYTFHINEVTGVDGDDVLHEGMRAIELAYARPNIAAKIGTDEFRNGRITSISFDESRGVDKLRGTITIEERLRAVDDAVLSEITDMIPSPQDVASFSEVFDFTRGANSYNYSRNIELRYAQDAGGDFVNKARLFMKNVYLNNRPSFGYQVDGISENGRLDAGLKPNIEETIDHINKSLTYVETLETARIENSEGLPFSRNTSESHVLQPDGFISKSVDVSIKALTEPLESNIASGVIYTVDNVISQYSGEFGIPTSISKGVNAHGGNASVSIQFSNDPRLNTTTSIDYSAGKTEDSQGFDAYSFNLTVSSRGKNDPTRFDLNRTYWQNNNYLPYVKIPVLFPEVTSGDLNEVSRSVSFAPFDNSVSDNSQFTTNPDYEYTEDGILRRSVTVVDNKPVERDFVVPIYGNEEIIIQGGGMTAGNRKVSVDMSADNIDVLVSGSLYFASGFAPDADQYFITSQSTNLDAFSNRIRTDLSYTYYNE